MNGALLLAADTFVWGVEGLCRLHLLPCDPRRVLRQFPPPYDLTSLQQAAAAAGLLSGLREVDAAKAPELPVPFVAVLKPDKTARPTRLALVIKCDWKTITCLEQGRRRSSTWTLDQFAAQFAGVVMLCLPDGAAPSIGNPPGGIGK